MVEKTEICNMKKTVDIIIEKTDMQETDKYGEVATQIVEVIKDRFSHSSEYHYKFDDEIQKKITDVLKNNFNIKNEAIGRNLMQDVRMFDHKDGYEFEAPLFTTPLLTSIGAMTIGPETFPNYSVENKYIGYTDKERFYRINDFTLFMRYMRKQPLAVAALFMMVFMMVAVAISIK
jgi:hypothetical protein